MRYVHLFLIFNLVVCYAGICGDTVFAVTSGSNAPESCHGSAHEMAESDEYALDIKSYGDQASNESPCCLDYLTGSSIENSNTVFTVIEVVPAFELYAKNLNNLKLGSHQKYKVHDPPDLQNSFCTFLL